MKIGRIINQIFHFGIIKLFLRYLLQPITLETTQASTAVAGNLTEQANGVVFGDPKFKPVLTACPTIMLSLPDKGSLTV